MLSTLCSAHELDTAGCLVLQPGQEYTMNFTFTQQPLNGFVAIWDPSAWENGTTPGSGVQLLAETNFPSAPSGVFVLPTPVSGNRTTMSMNLLYAQCDNIQEHARKHMVCAGNIICSMLANAWS
jgi:hypothetical protein